MYQDFLNEVLSLNNDIRVSLEITTQEAMQGTNRAVSLSSNRPCSFCGGVGRSGFFKACKECKGQGIVPSQQQIEVVLPPGTRTGETIRFREQGLYGIFARDRGDLYIEITVKVDTPGPLLSQPRIAPSFPQTKHRSFDHSAPTVADRSYQPASGSRFANHSLSTVKDAGQLADIPSSLGNYRVLCSLGEGGFASVYLGEHRYLGTHAAIKVLKEPLSGQSLQSFVEEAKTIATLKHPHIVRVLEFGVEEQTAFLVMDYAPGGTLRKLHPQGSRLPFRVILPYVKQIAAALSYAHNRSIVHRDIKPENMLIDADKTVLLSDFGIALQVLNRTQSMKKHDAVGTILYMAPEQIQGKPRAASDQYALAVVIYEWLCGRCPFDGLDDFAVAVQHVTVPPPLLRAWIPSISPAVERVVLKALSKDPHQRFENVHAFTQALEQEYQRS